jgi:DNA anti-recombination protein RmuC
MDQIKSSMSKNRKELEAKLAAVLDADLEILSEDFRKMLVDDLVTAFESRLSVLKNIQTGVRMNVELDNLAEYSIHN